MGQGGALSCAVDEPGSLQAALKEDHHPVCSGRGLRFHVRILLLVQILTSAIAAVDSCGQADTTIVMDMLTIQGNRIDIPFEEALRNIAIIGHQEILKRPALSLPEVLSYTPGVDIRQRGPLGVQADIGIRGGTFEQTLILVNGIKLTDPQTGHHSMNVPVPLENIERIEVLKGPGARIFGQNAFAGAVNFITRAPENRALSIRAFGGSFGTGAGSVSLSLPVGGYRQAITYNHAFSDGYRHNTDFSIGNAFYQGDLAVGKGSINVMGGYSDRKFGANGFYASPNFTGQYEEVQTALASVAYRHDGQRFRWSPRLYWRGNRDRYLFVREDPSAYENDHTTNVVGAEWNGALHWAAGTTGIGLEFRREGIAGDWVRGGTHLASNLDGFDRKNAGVYLEHQGRIAGVLDITPGLYAGWYTDFGWNLMPGIDFGYRLGKMLRLYANVGKSFRIPTFYDQYYVSPAEIGNPDLKPEEAVSYELGLRAIGRWYSGEANVFVRDASSVIDWVYDTADSLWRAGNYSNVRAGGLELTLELDFQRLFGRECMLESVRAGYTHIRQDLSSTERSRSRYVLDHIRNQLVVHIEHRVISKLHNNLTVRYIDRAGQPPYWIVDDRLVWQQCDRLRVFMEATNIGDVQYTEVMTPMPGRWIRGGVQMSLSF
jgi:iron complex outermembrane receptor protein